MKNWYLVTTKSSQQDRAEENLGSQMFEVYNPKFKVESKNDDKLWNLESAFDGYMFVRFDPMVQSAAIVNHCWGVRKLVTFGDAMVRIHDQLVIKMKQRFDTGEIVKRETPELKPQAYVKGDKVVIKDGPFDGIEAIFQEPSGDRRSFLLLDMLGNQQKLAVNNLQFS